MIDGKYGMIDSDGAEILSFETIFPGLSVAICNFHGERAWSRWASSTKYVSHIVSAVLTVTRIIFSLSICIYIYLVTLIIFG